MCKACCQVSNVSGWKKPDAPVKMLLFELVRLELMLTTSAYLTGQPCARIRCIGRLAAGHTSRDYLKTWERRSARPRGNLSPSSLVFGHRHKAYGYRSERIATVKSSKNLHIRVHLVSLVSDLFSYQGQQGLQSFRWPAKNPGVEC
jgi:hypothetical protein